ncbi:MAG: hypothetical protein LBJ25_06580 [Candidatus Margulisbacteria bacterium]|jgi:microcystin-dependent protein|nr:hypothetical protein [Candidatus Margulisiibacteriota bacterium]
MTRILHTKVETGSPLLASDITNLTFFPVGAILMMDGSWTNGRGGWYICDGQNGTPDLRDKFLKGNGSETAAGANWLSLTASNLPAHNHSLTNMSLTGLTLNDGGAHTHTLSGNTADGGSHNHTLTNGSAALAGGHSHTVTVHDTTHNQTPASTDSSSDEYGRYDSKIYTTSSVADHTHTVSGTIDNGGAHTHTLSGSAAEGGSHTHTVNSSNSTISGSVSSAGSGTNFNNMPDYYAVIYIKKMKEYV